MIIDIPEDDYNPDVNNCSDNKDDYDSYYEDVYNNDDDNNPPDQGEPAPPRGSRSWRSDPSHRPERNN